MKEELFDPALLRSRWEAREPQPAGAPPHPKLASVEAPQDSMARAQALFAELRARALRDLPKQRELLEPFFTQAEQELDALTRSVEAAETRDRANTALITLQRLESLLEVYYFLIPQR